MRIYSGVVCKPPMKIYSNKIIDRLISFQSEVDYLTYDKADIRRHFYDFIQSNQISYCNAYILLEISETFNKNGVAMR